MEVQDIIKGTNEENLDKVNWTKAWSSKYPVLKTYQNYVDVDKYKNKIDEMINCLKEENGYSELDSFLVLKDILYHEYLNKNK